MTWKTTLLIFLGLLYSVANYAVNIPNVRNCQSQNEYLQPGYVGTYGYNLSVVGGAVGSTPQTIGFGADCGFAVKSYRKCYHALQILDCKISEIRPPSREALRLEPSIKQDSLDSRKFSSLMKRHRVIFSLANGNVDNVIAHGDEPLAILNVKRGIISSLMGGARPQSDDQTQRSRTDVQGTCPVSYVNAESSGSSHAVHMVKDMNGCHFPGKVDWNYSPFSMFWNMSFIQTFYINSTAQCTFTFNEEDEVLVQTTCRERHAIGLDSTANTAISVQTNVELKTFLVSSAKHSDKSLPSTSNYLLKKIQYEYERTNLPTSTPSNFSSQVKDALSSLVAGSDGPIEPEIVDRFIKLVALLRSASDLDPIAKELIACDSLGLSCTPHIKGHLAKYFADALVHCNTVPCVRAFRHLVEEADSTVNDVHLYFVLYTWTNVKITDPDFFQEILAICIARKTRFCPLVLSSTIHTFWTSYQDAYIKEDLPTGITNSLDFVFNLIGDACERDDESDVLTGLKALGNMGSVAQKYNPEVTNIVFSCLRNDKVSWVTKLAAIKATRRFASTTRLYIRLLEVLKNASHDLEVRTESYKVLAGHWAESPEKLNDLTKFLHSDTADFQLKSFVLSHIKSILTRRNPRNANFAGAIRRAIESDSKLARLVAQSHHGPVDSSDRKSGHNEYFYYHETPVLRKVLNRFALRLGVEKLYEADSFLPFAAAYNFTVRLFDKEVDLLDVLMTTRGSENVVMSMGDLFAKRKTPIDGYAILAAIFQLLRNPGELAKLSSSWTNIKDGANPSLKHSSYQMDENFKKNLERIRRTVAKKFDPTKAATLMYGVQTFGDELFFTTSDLLKKTFLELSRSASQGMLNGPSYHSSGITQIVEAFNLIPLMTGTPLNWTTESFLTHSGHLSLQRSQPHGKFSVFLPMEFSGAAVLINNMIVDLPGFTYGGIQSYSTASTSFDTKMAVTFAGSNEVKLEIDPSKRPIRLVRLSRKNYIFSGPKKTELADYEVDRHNASWCLDAAIVPIMAGVRLCHSRSYPNVTHRIDKPWCLMAGSSHWQLMADFPDRDLKSYELIVENKPTKQDGVNVVARLSAIGGETQTLVTYGHRVNWSSGEYESQLQIPPIDLEAKATRRPSRVDKADGGGGFTTKAYVALHSHETHSLEYTTGERDVQLTATANLVSGRESIKPLVVLTRRRENYLNLTVRTPPAMISRSYSWNRTRSTNSQSDTIDHHFAYSGIQPSNPNNRLLGDIVWEKNSRSAWVNLRQKRHLVHGQQAANNLAYYHLKTPNSIIRLDTYTSGGHRFDWNLTKTMLASHELKTFLNVSLVSNSHHEVDGVDERIVSARLATPSQSTSVVSVRRWNKVDTNSTLSVNVDQTRVDLKGYDLSEPEVARRRHAHSHSLEFFSHVRNETAESIANSATQKRKSTSSTSKRSGSSSLQKSKTLWTLSLPGQKPIKLLGTYREDPFKNYQLNLSIANPTSNVRLDATNVLSREPGTKKSPSARLWMNHTLVASMAPFDDASKLSVALDASFVNGQVAVHQTIDLSSIFRGRLHLAWNLLAPAYNDLNLNVSVDSSIWNLLKLDLKQVVFVGGETMTIKHDLMDVDMRSEWTTGFKRTITFNSKVKDFLPNMIWTVDLTNPFEDAVVRFRFPDVAPLDVYLIARLARDLREIQFVFCRREKCRDTESDPQNFIGQWTYTLDDPTHLVETVVTNPLVIDELRKNWLPLMAKMSEVTMKALSSADHPLNRMLRPLLKVPIAQWCLAKVNTAVSTLYKMGHHVLVSILDMESIYNPCIQMVVRGYNYASTELYRTYSEPTFVPNFVPWFWSYFELKSVLATWTWDTAIEHWKRRRVVPGPVEESSHVTTYRLPIHLDTFVSRPRLNAAYSREVKDALQLMSTAVAGDEEPDLREVFQRDGPSMYDRFALVWGSGRLRTFDGHFVDLMDDDDNKGAAAAACSTTHLLLHNTLNGKVTMAATIERSGNVAHDPDLVLIFPQLQIRLQQDGKIYLNGSDQVTDAPIRSWDGYVNVTRSENVLSVNTFHHVDVKCVVDERYCLIGTTPWTHGLLVGLLGNNNGDATDDRQAHSGLILSSQKANCTSTSDSRRGCSSGANAGFACDAAFNYQLSPTTAYCHDVVDPTPFANRCRLEQGGNVCQDTFDCSTVRSYLALCAANGLPVDSSSECSVCSGEQHRLDESWQDVVHSDVDIVLMADQRMQKPSSGTALKKGLELLVESIERTFTNDGYRTVRFGLVDFRSGEQHSINGKLLSTVDDFVRFALKQLDFRAASSSSSKSNNDSAENSAFLDALQTACKRFPLSSTAVRIFLLLTSEDPPEGLNPERLWKVLEDVEAEAAAFYVLSDYPSVAKGTKIYGVRGDGKIFPQSKGKTEQFTDYPKGQYSKLASATRGAIFLRSFLELPADSKGPFNRYVNAVASEMLARARQDVGLCRSCRCGRRPINGYAPKIKCHQFKCSE